MMNLPAFIAFVLAVVVAFILRLALRSEDFTPAKKNVVVLPARNGKTRKAA